VKLKKAIANTLNEFIENEDNYFIDITSWALKCPGLTEKAERAIKKAVV